MTIDLDFIFQFLQIFDPSLKKKKKKKTGFNIEAAMTESTTPSETQTPQENGVSAQPDSIEESMKTIEGIRSTESCISKYYDILVKRSKLL